MKKWIIIGIVVLVIIIIIAYVMKERKKTAQAQAEIDLQRQLAGRTTETPGVTETKSDLGSIVSSIGGLFSSIKNSAQKNKPEISEDEKLKFAQFQQSCIAKYPGNMALQTACLSTYKQD